MPDWKWANVEIIRRTWNYTPDGEIAVAVAYSEHGLNCTGVSPTNDYGLFQLHNIPVEDCEENARIAYEEKYKKRGFQPWTDYRNGKYLKYLTS